MEDGVVTIKTELDTKDFEQQIKATETELERMVSQYNRLQQISAKGGKIQQQEMTKLAVEIEKTRNKLVGLKEKQDALNNSKFNNIKEAIGNVGNSVEKVTKKVIKWGLAIFSVRSAYMLVRQAVSTLSNTNEQIGTDIAYIRYAIATALQPIIEEIVQLVYKMLAYVNYIAMAWFKVNLFANATTKSFKNANKSAKELKKTLAGFDEMNILNKDGTTGVGTPSFDLSGIENVKIPDWVDTIAKNKDLILGFFGDFVKIIATAKIASFVLGLTGITTALKAMSGLTLFATIGTIAITIVGIYNTVSSIIRFIGDPTWDNFSDILSGVAITLAGIGATMILINASNPLGWITLAIGGLIAIIGYFTDWGNEAEETTTKLKGTKTATEELKEAQDDLNKQTSSYTKALKNHEKAHKNLQDVEKKNKISGEQLYNSFLIGITRYEDMNAAQREVFDAYVEEQSAASDLKEEVEKLSTAQEKAKDKSSTLSGAIYEETGQLDDYFQTLLNNYGKSEQATNEFYKNMNWMLYNMDEDTRNTFVKNLPDNVKEGILNSSKAISGFPNVVIAQSILIRDNMKKTFGKDIPDAVEKGLNSEKITNAITKFKNKFNEINFEIFGIKTKTSSGSTSKNAKGAIVYPSRLPKLASGGIINMPGRGVPLAVGGERGAEGVVPLTDSQQMELLGEAIGRYITVNLTNITKLDGRQIARKVDKVQQNNNFIFNR